jgi:VWFA-related protein
LQQFTNDRRQLYAAIEKVRWNPMGSGKIGAFAPLEGRMDTGPDEEPEPGERTAEGVEREFNDFRESIFATGTLGAINYIVRGMQELPGRKSVMLLSDGFSLFTRDASGSVGSGRVLQSLRQLVDMANRASVVIYTMDARGLQVTGLSAADDTSGRTADQIEEAMSERRNRLFDTQDGLRYLAKQTGGISIINSNDLVGGIRKILDDQSYYLIAYEPDDATFDPRTRRFNKLEIKVNRPGLRVRYRSGFFGVSDEKIVRPPQSSGQRLIQALSSPFAVNDISVRLNALFASDAKTGSFIRSLVHIKAQDLKFSEEKDGTRKASFDILAVGFGDNGVAVDQISKSYDLTMKPDIYERVMKSGFVYDFTFPIKKAGAYQLRVALRDHGNDNVGSANQFVEVPNIKKNRLVLSGVLMENLPYDVWQRQNAGEVFDRASDVLTDTSLRQFKQGTILRYGTTIYNAKPPGTVTYLTRIFRDGKPIFEGKEQPVQSAVQSDAKFLNLTAALHLGAEMLPGDYVLQITVTDTLAKSKRNTAVQFVQFEIVE